MNSVIRCFYMKIHFENVKLNPSLKVSKTSEVITIFAVQVKTQNLQNMKHSTCRYSIKRKIPGQSTTVENEMVVNCAL